MRRRIIGFLIFIVVAVGVAVGVYLAGEASDGTTGAQEGPERLFPIPTDVPAEVQLPVEPADIQVGGDGKLFVPDRGDGCPLREKARQTFEGREWVLLGNSTCELAWRYAPDTGEVAPVTVVRGDTSRTEGPSQYRGPTPTPAPFALGTPKPGQALAVPAEYIKLGPDGTYFRPDVGDGCVYYEASRWVEEGQEWVLLQSPTCDPDLLFAPATSHVRALLPSFRLGPDGKYFKIDHMGCGYREVSRFTEGGREWVRLESPVCGGDILLAPTAGEVRTVWPSPTPTPTPPIKGVPRSDPPSPSEIKLGPDGKYVIPDRGDGCPWTERGTLTLPDGTVQVIFETKCAADFAWFYRPSTGKIGALAVSMFR